MPDLIRPEVRAALFRWREVMAAFAVVVFGIWSIGAPGPVLKGVGAVAVIAGTGLILIALRRLAFRGSGTDPGVVTIDEGQITYFGPQVGGAISRPSLREIRLRTNDGAKSWFLISDAGEALAVPHGARDAHLLFDAFSALPGFDADATLRQLRSKSDGSITVWRRPGERVLTSLTKRDSH